ncbi:hypothetical protein MLD38_026325 [Melastoma candidum]|uniref:Uncharacterized protein n=1 Tax=Melastoma candidum TaxID=119954 RepID=A0ACB9P3C9_9MYRT|nr:hypothetical protein MLD38_026325 [Melastoma candidum]
MIPTESIVLTGEIALFGEETNSRKKVKLAGNDEGDDLSLVHLDFHGEGSRDQSRDAANVPKTSEYTFFKMLKEERHRKSHLSPLPVEDDHAERLWLTNRCRGNGDSSAAVILKDVIPAQLPTACLPAICLGKSRSHFVGSNC